MKLRLRIGPSTSCYHAAAALLAGEQPARPELATALEPPTITLRSALEQYGVPVEKFLEHAAPLSAVGDSQQELVGTALSKAVGRAHGERATPAVRRAIGELLAAFDAALPNLADELSLRQRPIEEQWQARGPGLLVGVRRMTEPELLVDEADVILVYPFLGGGGAAHPRYNSIRFEALLANPVPGVPEVVRLAWLLAQLNLDLPRYADHLNRTRLLLVARLTLVPIVLHAAEEVELLRYDLPTLQSALQAWHLVTPSDEHTTRTLDEWWQVYADSRPDFVAGLLALDRMLSDTA